jgi:hypothetical protein
VIAATVAGVSDRIRTSPSDLSPSARTEDKTNKADPENPTPPSAPPLALTAEEPRRVLHARARSPSRHTSALATSPAPSAAARAVAAHVKSTPGLRARAIGGAKGGSPRCSKMATLRAAPRGLLAVVVTLGQRPLAARYERRGDVGLLRHPLLLLLLGARQRRLRPSSRRRSARHHGRAKRGAQPEHARQAL